MEFTLGKDEVKEAVAAAIDKLVQAQGKGLIQELLRDILGDSRRNGTSLVVTALRRMVQAEMETQLQSYLAANENYIRERIITAIAEEFSAEKIAEQVVGQLRTVTIEVPLIKTLKSAYEDEDDA